MNSDDTPKPMTPIARTSYILSLTFASLAYIGTLIVSGLATNPEPEKFGFKNQTGAISDQFYTQITPAGWAFVIWTVIYIWEGILIIYAWTFLCRPSFPITISPTSLIFYSCGNIFNITWLYVWGNEYPTYAFGVIILSAIFLYIAIGVEAIFIYKNTFTLESQAKYKIDLYLTRFLVLNCLTVYATWLTIATLVNFTLVLQYFADVSGINSGIVGLSLLTVEVIVYFILENTVLDSFARYIVAVYPVIIWALSAVIDAHWGVEDDNRNSIFTLVLLIMTVVLFIVRLILIATFTFLRPTKYPKNSIVIF